MVRSISKVGCSLVLVVVVEVSCCSRLHTGLVDDLTSSIRVPLWLVVRLWVAPVGRTVVEGRLGNLEAGLVELVVAATETEPLTGIAFESELAMWMKGPSLLSFQLYL